MIRLRRLQELAELGTPRARELAKVPHGRAPISNVCLLGGGESAEKDALPCNRDFSLPRTFFGLVRPFEPKPPAGIAVRLIL
jgi:hypothetical protein